MSILECVQELSQELKKRQWTVVTAESCTGGGLAYYLTALAGSSDWFDRGFVTYSNSAKEKMLGVTRETLETFGAVSEEAAKEMAEGALKASEADWSLSITGIAGPTGGTPEKPVGTVCFAWQKKAEVAQTETQRWSGNRNDIREQTILHALEKLLILVREKN